MPIARAPDYSWTANRYAGLARGIESLGENIAAIIERKKTQEKLGKQAEQMLGLLAQDPELAKIIPKDVAFKQSREQQIGTLQNVMTLMTIKEKMQEAEESRKRTAGLVEYYAGQAEERKARAAAATREAEATAQLPAFFNALVARTGQPAVGPIRPDRLDTQGRWTQPGAFLSASEIAPRALEASQFEERAKAVQALLGMGQEAELGEPQFKPVPGAPGSVAWWRGNTAGIATDPNVRAQANLEAQKGLLEFKAQQRQQFIDAGYQPFKKPDGTEVPNVYVSPDGKLIDLRSQLEKSLGGFSPGGSTSGGSTNAPAGTVLRFRKNSQTGKVEQY